MLAGTADQAKAAATRALGLLDRPVKPGDDNVQTAR